MIHIFRKAVGDEHLAANEELSLGTWIDMVNPTEEEIQQISSQLSVEPDFLKSALDVDEKPRIETENKATLIIIRVPFQDEATKIDMIPISIVITERVIITVSLKETVILQDVREEKIKNLYTTKKTRFVLQILARTNYYFQKYLADIEKKITHLEKTLLKSFKNEEIVELLDIQKSLVFINTSVVSNDKILERILKGNVLKLYKEDEDLLEDIIIENKESIEMVNIFSNILANTMDAYASIISNNLNIVMKFLASVTIILAIPAIVAGFYGMNVSLPFQKSPYAFYLVVTFSLLITVLTTFFFLKKKYF